MPTNTDVAVIGAGPYGLSLGAHLGARGVRFRIFGRPMDTWRSAMPEGMFLKSPGRASSLSAPSAAYTLEKYCLLTGREYRDWDRPVPVELFLRYGEWFQAQLVPRVETESVTACDRGPGGFRLRLESGERVRARAVVVASGYRHSARTAEELSGLPPHLASHSSHHHSFRSFQGKRVVVLGAGQSALESAALLQEAGASAILLARRDRLQWNPPPVLRQSLYQALRSPRTGLGVGLRYAFYEHPFLPFYYLPRDMRWRHVDSVLGPAGAWWLRGRVMDKVPSRLGWRLRSARAHADEEVVLHTERNGQTQDLRADHVIAATGYRVSPDAFPFLSDELKTAVRWENGSPVLSRRFESAVSGLHFIGLASAGAFGPVMRFVDGAQVTAPRLARHLAKRHGTAGSDRT